MTNAMQAKLPRQALKSIKIELFMQVEIVFIYVAGFFVCFLHLLMVYQDSF